MLTYTTALNAFQLGKTSGWLIKKSVKENILKAFFDILNSFRLQMFAMPGSKSNHILSAVCSFNSCSVQLNEQFFFHNICNI